MRDISDCLQSRAGSLGAPAHFLSLPQKLQQIRRGKTPREVGIQQPDHRPGYGWLQVPGPLTPFPQHDVFILSASLFTVEAAQCRKEELYQPAEILILLTSILELQQLQPALEALLGRLWGGLCWAAGAPRSRDAVQG